MANVFENNEPVADQDAINELGERVHAMLPPLAEGYRYEIQKLASGRAAVIVESDSAGEAEDITPENADKRFGYKDFRGVENTSCGCGPYQGCSRCKKYQGDGLNSPESRTIRHEG